MPIVYDESSPASKAELDARLTEFNESHLGPRNRTEVGLSIRDDAGQLVAGLSGEFFWNVLHVDLIWVDQRYRRQGYGRLLLQRAENLARARRSDVVYLSTFDFQAPAFYTALGYGVIGDLPDVPKGSRRLWFAKRLTD